MHIVKDALLKWLMTDWAGWSSDGQLHAGEAENWFGKFPQFRKLDGGAVLV